ncbi:MAG TPA: hypothetical protein VF791_03315 [Pyrinomonadaceae bacterium]
MRKKRGHIIDDIHLTPDVTYIQNPDVSHEASDVNVRSILIFTGGLLVFGIIVHILMWLMFNYMEDRANKSAPPPRPMAMTEKERLEKLPGPRLQGAPGFGVNLGQGRQTNLELKEPQAEFKEIRRIWKEVLEGRADPRDGKISMPIEEAMRKVVTDGQLKTRAPADNQEQIDMRGSDVPSYQSSGRLKEKRDQ